MVLDITATSARIQWTIPFIVSTQESYYVVYGLNSSELTLQSAVQSSGLNVSTVYFQFLSGLDAAEIYYFRVVASNDAGETRSDLESFITSNGRKYSYIKCVLQEVYETHTTCTLPV